MISPVELLAHLSTSEFGRRIYSFDAIDSTNVFARSLTVSDAPHGTLIIAEYQKAGKGRLGRGWDSDPEKNLLFSLVLRPPKKFRTISLLPMAAAVAMTEGILQAVGIRVRTKWPNDLLIGDKKICGMLLESALQESSVQATIMGIGLNVNQTRFPKQLESRTTSLALKAGHVLNRIPLMAECLAQLEKRYLQLLMGSAAEVISDWKNHSDMIGRTVLVTESDHHYNAEVLDIAPDGSLMIRKNDGTFGNIYAADVSIGTY